MDYQGCIFLQEGINFDLNTVCDCCISHNDGRGLPVLLENYHGELINWEDLFNKKAQRIEKQKIKTIFECENCYHLNDFKFDGTRKISEFHFSHCRACNAKCIYCSDEYSGGDVNYDVYPVIKDLIDKGYYKAGGEATMQGGEPTLMRHFDELVHLFNENGTIIRVHTSAIKYSKTLEEALRQNRASVVISLDSGCASTYKRIKNVDAFDKVVNSIKGYVNASVDNPYNVRIKYIIIPGVNDNLNEIDKFFDLMKKLNIVDVALDIEVKYAREHNNKDVSKHIFLLVDYFEKKAKELNIKLSIYSFLSYVMKNRNIKKTNLINIKFLFNWYLKLNNNKEKNLVYHR